jgi:hypothetical protein
MVDSTAAVSTLLAAEQPELNPSQAGGMFWFTRKRLSGSYWRFDLTQPVEVGPVGGDHPVGLVVRRVVHVRALRRVWLKGGEGVPHPLHVDLRVGRIRPLAGKRKVEAGFAVAGA